MKTKSETSRHPVCVFCQRSGAGVLFTIFNPRFPPFGTACSECEDSVPKGTVVPGTAAPNTAERNLPLVLGKVVKTAGVFDWASTDWNRQRALLACVARHTSGDWGDVDAEDAQANDTALDARDPLRVLSSYTVDRARIWIITEWDRSVTTILFPEEY